MQKSIVPLVALALLTSGCKFFSNLFSTSSTNESNLEKIIEVDINNVTINLCHAEIPPLKINITSTEFSRAKTMLLAALMETVYRTPNDEYKKIMTQWGFRNFAHAHDSKTGAEYIIASNNDLILIGFVGSNEIIDWLKDMEPEPVKSLHFNGLVHKGMNDGFDSVLAGLSTELNTMLIEKNRPIMFAGHSLGGAHALLAAEYFAIKNTDGNYTGPKFNINAVYTFGQPRVGDSNFTSQITNSLKERYVRIYNGYDPVTHLFPRMKTSIEQLRIIAPVLFKINNWDITLKNTAYTHPESLLVKLREADKGADIVTPSEEEASDNQYWSGAVNMVNKYPVDAATFITHHMSGKYVCNSLRFYNKNRLQ